MKMTEGSLSEFLEAAANGDLNRLSFYASHGKPRHIDSQHPETGDTALILAAERNFPEVIGFLLEHGADVTLCNFNNQTALHVAKEEIQRQLLSALTRTSFPQLRLTQAAWQGDPEAVQHLLSAEPLLDANVPNHQGLTPLLLALRDGDLFDKLNIDYKPLDVLRELVKHGADPRLCDFNGKSALRYALEVKSPLRQQLIDVLTMDASGPEVEDDAFCGFCPDTKSLLFPRTATRREHVSPAAPTCRLGSQLNKDEICSSGVEEEDICNMEADSRGFNKTDFRILNDLQKGARVLQDVERLYKKYEIQRTSLPRQWLTEPLPAAAVSKSESRPYTLPPPACVKTEDISEKMKSLGLGYLLQASRSEPNISQTARANPLADIAGIKQNIWQRLTTPESARTTESSYSSRHSPRTTHLAPLKQSTSRKWSEVNITNTVPPTSTSDAFPESTESGLSGCHKDFPISSQLDNLEELNVSRDLIFISIGESLVVSEHLTDSRTHRSGRGCHVSPSDVEKYNVSPPSEDRAMSTLCLPGDSVDVLSENEDDILYNNMTFDEERESSHPPINENKSDKAFDRSHLKHEINLVEWEGVLQEPTKPDSLRTPMHGVVPCVHITFSELEPEKEPRLFSAKQGPKKKKGSLSSVPHNVNHSFNIIAQKESEKTKKNKKVRNKSAPDASKGQRPLSNSKRTNLKSLPAPSLGFTACPASAKGFKKVHHLEQINSEKYSHRSHTPLAFYTPIKVPKQSITRSRTAPDFTYIKDTDMFVKLNPQNGGPGVFQMFETSFYTKEFLKENSHLHGDSDSSSKGLNSKSIRSVSANDGKCRTQRRVNCRNKKGSSATAQKRKGPSTKATTGVQNETEDTVIISGTDWKIEATKHQDLNICNDAQVATTPTEDDQHIFSDLSIIEEVTIEGSVSIHGVNFKEMFKEMSRHSDEQHLKPAINGNLLQNEHGQEGMDLSNRNLMDHKGETQNDQPLEVINIAISDHKSFASCNENQADLMEHSSTECLRQCQSVNQDHSGSTETTPGGKPRENDGDSEHFLFAGETDEVFCTDSENENETEYLIAQLVEKIILIDEIESSVSKTSESAKRKSETLKTHNQDEDFEEKISSLKEGSKIASLNANNSNNLNLSEDPGEFSHSMDGKITWIRGEVLGKGAYGTVYCGLTRQGELIAAKQVTLDASDTVTAEKEYKKLQEEVELLKTLKHDNIVGFLGTSLQDNMVTIFMEFVPGGSIFSILKRFGPLHEIVIRKYTKHILHGIAYLHRKRVIHRDIKGNNVMLMPNGVLKLIDFGCAKRLTCLSMSGTRNELLLSMHGTPYWMAPEVINESGHGEKSDIWSIGCTVFEMATGKPPLAHMHKLAAMYYIGANRGLMPTLPDHFSKRARDFVDLCLTRNQEDRPSAEQLLQHPLIKRLDFQ